MGWEPLSDNPLILSDTRLALGLCSFTVVYLKVNLFHSFLACHYLSFLVLRAAVFYSGNISVFFFSIISFHLPIVSYRELPLGFLGLLPMFMVPIASSSRRQKSKNFFSTPIHQSIFSLII